MVLSNGFLELGTFVNPAHCSNVLGPNFFTFLSSFLLENSPFSSLYLTMFPATVFEIPDT